MMNETAATDDGLHYVDIPTAREDERRAGRYLVKGGQTYIEKADGELPVRVAYFEATITAHVVYDDGAMERNLFRIVGTNASGPLPEIEVPLESYSSMSWPVSHWGNGAILRAGTGNKDAMREAVQLTSGSVPTETVYQHTGWRVFGDTWRYLHAGGGIDGGGHHDGISVDLDGRMASYRLPAPPDKAVARGTIGRVLKLLEIAPGRPALGWVLLAIIGRAPLCEAYAVRWGLWLAGKTQTLKTETATVLQSFWGAGFAVQGQLPGAFSDSITDLPMKAHAAKDGICVVDDYQSKGTRQDQQRLAAKADDLFRGAGNQAGRGRRTSDLKARPVYYPRGIVVGTGEDVPPGHSLRARLLTLELVKGDVDSRTLTELQGYGRDGICAVALSGYLQWLAPQMPVIKERLPEECRRYRSILSFAHPRGVDQYADLWAGIDCFLRYAEEVGAIAARDGAEYRQQADEAFRSILVAQGDLHADQDEVQVFLSLLKSAFAAGRCHVLDQERQTEPVSMPHAWGWRSVPDGVGGTTWEPMGERVGWINAEELLLNQDAAYNVVQRLAGFGADIQVTRRTLWRRLNEDGYMGPTDEGRNQVYRRCAGVRQRVAPLLLKKLADL